MAREKALKAASLRELNFLCAFILSEKFCALFCKAFKPGYFENADYRALASYVQSYFAKYAKPPRKLVVSHMEKHQAKFRSAELYDSLKKTLVTSAESIDGLLEKYEDQYIIDDAELFIKAAELRKMSDEVLLAIDGGDEEKALQAY